MAKKYFVQTLKVYPLQGTGARLLCVESRTPGFCNLRITNVGKPLQNLFVCCEEGSLYGAYTKPSLPLLKDYFNNNESIQLETFLIAGMKNGGITLCWQENGEEKYAIIRPVL